jgi:hypothetical protein
VSFVVYRRTAASPNQSRTVLGRAVAQLPVGDRGHSFDQLAALILQSATTVKLRASLFNKFALQVTSTDVYNAREQHPEWSKSSFFMKHIEALLHGSSAQTRLPKSKLRTALPSMRDNGDALTRFPCTEDCRLTTMTPSLICIESRCDATSSQSPVTTAVIGRP